MGARALIFDDFEVKLGRKIKTSHPPTHILCSLGARVSQQIRVCPSPTLTRELWVARLPRVTFWDSRGVCFRLTYISPVENDARFDAMLHFRLI